LGKGSVSKVGSVQLVDGLWLMKADGFLLVWLEDGGFTFWPLSSLDEAGSLADIVGSFDDLLLLREDEG
jgi:hypothetical protein